MIDLTTGVPGSGKTYRLVHKIYELITAENKKYKHIFTNINGLDLDKCNKLANEPDYVKTFEFLDLKKHMDIEFEYHKKSKESIVKIKDDDYDESLTELKLLKESYDEFVKSKGVYDEYMHSLIIVDECHLYFEDRVDEILIRFLSYHRHFDIDIDLITQNKNLINKKYLSFIETMYVAYPASKRFFSKSFRYKKYASYQEYNSNIIGTTSLKLEEKIFTLYSSGSNKLSKTSIYTKLLPILILSILTFVGFKLFLDYISPTNNNKDNSNAVNTVDNNNSNATIRNKYANSVIDIDENENNSKTSFFVVDCFTHSCIFKNIDMTFDRKSLMQLIDRFNCEILVNNVSDVNYYTYILECDKKLNNILRLFNKKNFGVKNEKDSSFTGFNNMLDR